MAYNGLTNAGAAYLAARQANKLPVEFLKAKVGNGIVPSGTDPAELTDIISGKMEVEITDIDQVERALKMTVQISNESLTTGFYLTEIAIFVNDNGTPVLYWYIGKDNGTYVPDSTKPMKYKNILNIEVSSTPVTTVNYTGKDLWIDEETLNAKFGTKEKEILEGIQLARTLGLEYGGELNNSNTKKLNTVYYDTQNKSFFKCFRENTLNYADSNYYEGISNNDLLLKLQNLSKIETYYKTENGVIFTFKRIGNLIFYNSSNKINFSVVGKAKIFNIDNPRFIPKYDAYICSVVSLSTVYDGSISTAGEITLNFGSSPVQPFIALQGIGIAKD